MKIPEINPKDFIYNLSQDRIPSFPELQRDKSKLLFYNKGNISNHLFDQLPQFLSSETMLVLNDTKVFPARLIFKKSTGAEIEIFCLSQLSALDVKGEIVIWECIVGNLKRWKSDELLEKSNGRYFINLLIGI